MMDQNKQDVILAEDDLDDVLVFEMALKEIDLPVDVRHAHNGDVLFELLEQQVPDTLFLDIHMPCKDGLSCIVEIRKDRRYDRLPVIMYTASTTDRNVERAYRSGANLYITKTDTIKQLANKLRTVFSIDWKNYMHYPPLQHFVIS
jgi:CheY-like chemotaxis protein